MHEVVVKLLNHNYLADFINFLLLLYIVYQKIAQPNAVSMGIATNRKPVFVMQGGLAPLVTFKPVLLNV